MEPQRYNSAHPLSISHHFNSSEGEVNDEPSMMIPDMTISVQELYKRHRLGTLPAELVRSVLYDDCDDFDSVLAEHSEGYDLVDAQRELDKLRQKFEAMHNISSVRDVSHRETSDKDETPDASPSESNSVADESSGAAHTT